MPGDPRGGTVRVDDGAQDVLTGVCSGEGESAGSTSKLRARLAPTDSRAGGLRGEGELRDSQGRAQAGSRWRSRASRPATTRSSSTASSAARSRSGSLGRGQIEFGDDNGGPPLDFDPRGKVIDVASSARACSSAGRLDGTIPGVNQCTFSETETALVAAPAAGGGQREHEAADPRGLPARLLGGDRGRARRRPTTSSWAACCAATIEVADVGGGRLKGELEFTSEPGERRAVPRLRAGRRDRRGEAGRRALLLAHAGRRRARAAAVAAAELRRRSARDRRAAPRDGGLGRAQGDAALPRSATTAARTSRSRSRTSPTAATTCRSAASRAARSRSPPAKGELEFSDPVEPGKTLLDFDPARPDRRGVRRRAR